GHEVGMQVRLDDVADRQPVFPGRVEVFLDVPPRVDDGGLPVRTDHVGRLRQASQVELLEVHVWADYASISTANSGVSRSRREARRQGQPSRSMRAATRSQIQTARFSAVGGVFANSGTSRFKFRWSSGRSTSSFRIRSRSDTFTIMEVSRSMSPSTATSSV